MHQFYDKCISDDNISKAIKYVINNNNNQIKTVKICNEKDIIKEVKHRLRRHKKVYLKNNKYTFLSQVTQRAIYQVIQLIINQHSLKNSSGFRYGFRFKHNISQIATNLFHTNQIFIIKIDLKNYITNLLLNNVLAYIKTYINDYLLLKTIKHVMWKSRDYKGIGLDINNDLDCILIDGYFHIIDKWADQMFTFEHDTHYLRDFERHKDHYNEWRIQRNKKLRARYLRFGTELVFLCRNRTEQICVLQEIKQYLLSLNIILNDKDITTYFNDIHIANYYINTHIINDKKYINIYIDNLNILLKDLKKFKFNSYKNILKFYQWLLNILSYYDIANNIGKFLNLLGRRLLTQSVHKKHLLQKEALHVKYYFKLNTNKLISIDIYKLRKYTKLSYSDYLKKPKWLVICDQLKSWNIDYYSLSHLFTYVLYIYQKGKDPIDNQYLNINDMQIHHIKSLKNNGKNELSNLILINSSNHKLIHNSINTKSIQINKFRKLI